MKKLLQGMFLGLSLILPGMSGGTAFVIMGIYNQVLEDIASLNLRPYITFGLGVGGGLVIWAYFFSHLLDSWPEPSYAFLLGALWASAPLLLKDRDNRLVIPFTWKRFFYLAGGALLGLLIALEPLGMFHLGNPESLPVIFAAGIISSATMLIPGISGSAILLILGIYHEILGFLRFFTWLPLSVFALGCGLGLIVLARVISLIYKRYRPFFSFFIAGLIIGSGRALFPDNISIPVFIAALAGAFIVTKWGGKGD